MDPSRDSAHCIHVPEQRRHIRGRSLTFLEPIDPYDADGWRRCMGALRKHRTSLDLVNYAALLLTFEVELAGALERRPTDSSRADPRVRAESQEKTKRVLGLSRQGPQLALPSRRESGATHD